MTELAGEVADGVAVHAFSTPRYIAEVTLPAFHRGRARGGRSEMAFDVSVSVLTALAADDAGLDEARARIRSQIAFYASTPSYRTVLELHGWGGLGDELNAMTRRGEWAAMGDLIDDDMFDAFAIACRPADVARVLEHRYDGLATRVTMFPADGTDERLVEAAMQGRVPHAGVATQEA